jgi:signal transduction histidine kinase
MMAAETPDRVVEIASETASDVLELPINGVFLYDSNRDALVSRAASPVAHELFELPFGLDRPAGIAWDVYRSGEPQSFGDVRTADAVYNPETPVRSEIVLPLDDHGVMKVASTEVDALDDSAVPLAKVLAANTSAALTAAKREQTLRERERMLQQHNEQLEEFAGVVSHDLRNPLDVAQGRVELFIETGDTDHVRKASAAHERMAEIIDNVLTMARRGQTVSALDTVDLSTITADAWSNVATAEAQLTTADPPVIEADETRLKHLLENLFRNAIEHGGCESSPGEAAVSDGGTAVTLTVGEITVDERTEGFYVADDGPDIPQDERDEIFESGYSTAESGTGFGLSIVDQIATAHGWSIAVTRSADGGARFEITDVRTP